MKRLLAAAILLASPLLAWAQMPVGTPAFDLITLSAQAEREVPNDTLYATLAAEAEGTDPAALADRVNQAMRRALDTVREVRGVKARSGSYQTFPVHDQGRIQRWRVRQELRLESADFATATELIGKLQANLVVAQMALGVSPEARKKAEDALFAEAIAAFEDRARLARDALKAKGYRIRNLDLSGGGAIAPRAFAARAMAAEVAPPAVEAGTTRIAVTAHGTVQLQ